MQELTDEQRIAYARQLQTNPVLKLILDDMLTQTVNEWDGTADADTDKREMAWRKRQAVSEFANRITTILLKEQET